MQDSVCNQLLRTRPLANTQDGQLRLHGQPIAAQTSPESKDGMSPILPKLQPLYLIVPKKRYRLAVDRNRVKRVVKAQLALHLGDYLNSHQWVFRTPSNKASGVCINPHTQAFQWAVSELAQQARLKLAATHLSTTALSAVTATRVSTHMA